MYKSGIDLFFKVFEKCILKYKMPKLNTIIKEYKGKDAIMMASQMLFSEVPKYNPVKWRAQFTNAQVRNAVAWIIVYTPTIIIIRMETTDNAVGERMTHAKFNKLNSSLKWY